MSDGPPMFVLTDLTRDAKQNRRRVVAGFDVPYTSVVLAGMALLPGILLMMLLMPFLGSTSLLGVVFVELAAFWLFRSRSQQGMKLKNWETLRDKRRAEIGVWRVAGIEFDPFADETATIVHGSTPNTGLPEKLKEIDRLDVALGRT